MTQDDFLEYVEHPDRWVSIVTCPDCKTLNTLNHEARDRENDLKYKCPGCGRTVYFETLKGTKYERVTP